MEWRTLWDLVDAGPLTIRDLGAIQRSDHSLVSRALPEMRKKGYVTMPRDMQDERHRQIPWRRVGRLLRLHRPLKSKTTGVLTDGPLLPSAIAKFAAVQLSHSGYCLSGYCLAAPSLSYVDNTMLWRPKPPGNLGALSCCRVSSQFARQSGTDSNSSCGIEKSRP